MIYRVVFFKRERKTLIACFKYNFEHVIATPSGNCGCEHIYYFFVECASLGHFFHGSAVLTSYVTSIKLTDAVARLILKRWYCTRIR